MPAAPRSRICAARDIKVYHYGYLAKNVKGQDKRRRNIAILRKELAGNPGYGFALFNHGNEYYAMGDNANALEYYEASHAVFDPPQGYSAKLLLKLSNRYMNLGRFEDALRVIGEGRGRGVNVIKTCPPGRGALGWIVLLG
jgi:tetratricopeptide (TPR) repeat protein